MKRLRLVQLLGIASLALFSANGNARSHCAEGEVVQFSCKIAGSDKVASLCGGYAISNYPKTEWLQYRFGKIGKVEFSYPPEKTGSLKKFEGTWFNKYYYLTYLFVNDKALYEIELSEKVAKGKTQIVGVINVEFDKKRHKLRCSKPVDREDWDSLVELIPRTFHSTGSGRDSFSFQYYNYIAK